MAAAESAAGDTPLFRQYGSAKQQHPDKLLFFRMGDFYELFHGDAERAAALLGLTLTRRRNSGGDVPMAGVPVHAVDEYISRLVRIGESVVVCEQVGEAVAGGLMDRRISRIVTPGTLTDQELLSDKAACIAMAVAPAGSQAGYAWLDLARGELRAGQCAPDELADHAARLQPAELLLPEGAPMPAGVSAATQFLPRWDFDPSSSRARMLERFGVKDLRGFGLEELPHAAAAAAALLGYAEQTQCQRLDHLWRIGVENAGEHLAMDAAARRSLELTRANADDGATLMQAIDSCASSMGSRLLAWHLHHPLLDQARLDARLDLVAALADCSQQVAAWLGDCCDMERLATRLGLGQIRPRELAAMRDTLGRLPGLAQLLAGLPAEVRQRLGPLEQGYDALHDCLARELAAEPAAQVRDGGVIAAGVSQELDRLRYLVDNSAQALADIETSERQRSGIASLRAGHNRVHGYYLEIPRSKSDAAPEHFQRRQTLKHAERYVTTELRALEAEELAARDKIAALEQSLYAQLVERLQQEVPALQRLATALAALDVAASWAGIARRRGWVRPDYAPTPVVEIAGGRHPVVETAVDHFVANDVVLGGDKRLAVVTGPNMGGKSTYMRQVALIVLLAHIGAPVPAAKARIGRIESIHTRIGSSDDLAGGRSTFMVEMAETAQILNSAGPASLVVLDEIGRGTSTFDGLSLAWATAESLLSRNRSLVLLATHYLEMAQLADTYPEAENVHMAVGDAGGKVVMLHRIEKGAASRSFGLQVATMAGVPKGTLRLAAARLAELEALQAAGQPSLFGAGSSPAPQAPVETPPALSRLRDCDPDALSPKQALELLYELRALDVGD